VVVHCKEVGTTSCSATTALSSTARSSASAIIAANALVAPREVIPPYFIVMGVPGIARPARPEQIAARRSRQGDPEGGYFANAMKYRAAGIEERHVWGQKP
jgi:carbonic anhydrase/acetyltransferase-like protein (isoleucine patch superfamily)